MPVKQVINKGRVPVFVYTDELESSAYDQLVNVSQLPFVFDHAAAMPDVHTGIGATVGAVIPTQHAIIPAAVGVDIGCGMNAVRLSLKEKDLPDNLKRVRNAIEDAVPVGFDLRKTDRALRSTIDALKKVLPNFTLTKEAINCHHNYVALEHHHGQELFITRKGAIHAAEGELGINTGSIGIKSYIVPGKGNKESFCSCSHGAGRRMSRTTAKQRFSKHDLEQQTHVVECRKEKEVIDEIPAAYKDIDQVMQNQSDLVDIVHTLKQLVCVKG